MYNNIHERMGVYVHIKVHIDHCELCYPRPQISNTNRRPA